MKGTVHFNFESFGIFFLSNWRKTFFLIGNERLQIAKRKFHVLNVNSLPTSVVC